MKKWSWIIFSIFVLTGCANAHEIEEQALVVAIGLDNADEDMINVTFQISNPQAGLPNTGGEKEPASDLVTITAPDYLTARDLANASITRKINFSHTKVIVMGEEFAKTEKGSKHLISGIRDKEIRREVNLIVSREKAADFLKNNSPVLETRPHKFFDLMTVRWEEHGLVPLSTLERFVEIFDRKADLFLAIYATTEVKTPALDGNEDNYLPGEIGKTGGNITQIIGSAVFKKGIMIGELTGEETRIAMNLSPIATAETMRVTLPDPLHKNFRVALSLFRMSKTDITINTEKNPVEIHVFVPIAFAVLAIPSGANYVTNQSNQELLRATLEKDLATKYESFIKKTQEEFKSNPFNWSKVARKSFWTLQSYEEFNFEEKYKDAKVDVTVKVEFTHFGKQLSPQ